MKTSAKALFAAIFTLFPFHLAHAEAALARLSARSSADNLRWDQNTLVASFARPKGESKKRLLVSAGMGRDLELPLWQPSNREAPQGLWIILPGTGSSPEDKMANYLAEKLAGTFDSVVLPNPFSSSFQRTFSRDALIGFPQKDLPDLVRLVNATYRAYVKTRGRPKEVRIFGLSLGGLYSVLLDKSESALNFRPSRYVAVNPPLDFQYAMEKLDASLRLSLPESELSRFYKSLSYLVPIFLESRNGEMDPRRSTELSSLLSASENMHRYIIGIAFQRVLFPILDGLKAHPSFVARVNRRALERRRSSITFQAFAGIVGVRLPPAVHRGLTVEQLMRELQLSELLAKSKRLADIYVIHSRDDFLINGSQLNDVDRVLGENLTVFRSGGHCGQIWTKEFWSHSALR